MMEFELNKKYVITHYSGYPNEEEQDQLKKCAYIIFVERNFEDAIFYSYSKSGLKIETHRCTLCANIKEYKIEIRKMLPEILDKILKD